MTGGEGALVRAGGKGAEGIIAKAAKGKLRDAERAFVERAAKDGLTGTAKDILKRREEQAVSLLGKEGRDAAGRVAQRAAAAEKRITPELARIVGATPGAELAGKEFRLKQLDSLERKIAGDVLDGNTVDQAAGGINDAVRYTIKAAPEDYSRVADKSISELRNAGFEPVAMTNSWGQEGYQGINSVWRDPASGQTFELQFHTPDSLDAKEATHPIYEMARVFPKGDPIRAELAGMQNSVFGLVPTPAGAPTIGPGG